MWLIALEAGLAFSLFAFFIWWTMFADKDEERDEDEEK